MVAIHSIDAKEGFDVHHIIAVIKSVGGMVQNGLQANVFRSVLLVSSELRVRKHVVQR